MTKTSISIVRKTKHEIYARPLGFGVLAIIAAMISACGNNAEQGAHVSEPAENQTMRDCDQCPDMVLIPPGAFDMGRDGGEPDRYDGPVRHVAIDEPFWVSMAEITIAQYREFVDATGHESAPDCNVFVDGSWGPRAWADWTNPGLKDPLQDDEPVVCVSWNDAVAFTDWLSTISGAEYRLLTEAEWEYVARAGAQTEFPWGEDPAGGCNQANMYDIDGSTYDSSIFWPHAECSDGFAGPSPVASLEPNVFGVYDIMGNVWEWLQDCYVLPYPDDAPTDGSAVEVEGECERRTVRGGSWETRPSRFAVAWRGRDKPHESFRTFGIRVARDHD